MEQFHFSEELDSYLKWAQDTLKVWFHPQLRLFQRSNGDRGVVAQEAISAVDTLVSVPWASLLNVHALSETPFVTLAAKESLREDDALALILLYEKHEKGLDSKWSMHVQLLPREYDSVMFWSPEEVENLRGSTLHQLAEALLKQVPEDYEALRQRKLNPDDESSPKIEEAYEWFTFEEYRWALGTIWSRFVSVAKPGEAPVKCMAPVFDLFNHLPSAEAAQGFTPSRENDGEHERKLLQPDGALQILTGQDWAAGEEVFLNYGPVSTSRMVMLYGCALGANSFDGVDVFCTMDPRAPGYVAKEDAFKKAGIDPNVQPFRVTLNRIPDMLLGALRVQRADEPSEMTPNALQRALLEQKVLSEKNERVVIDSLRHALTEMRRPLVDMADVAGRSSQDERLVVVDRMEMALCVKASEKDVITSVLGLLDQHEANLLETIRQQGAPEEKLNT